MASGLRWQAKPLWLYSIEKVFPNFLACIALAPPAIAVGHKEQTQLEAANPGRTGQVGGEDGRLAFGLHKPSAGGSALHP